MGKGEGIHFHTTNLMNGFDLFTFRSLTIFFENPFFAMIFFSSWLKSSLQNLSELLEFFLERLGMAKKLSSVWKWNICSSLDWLDSDFFTPFLYTRVYSDLTTLSLPLSHFLSACSYSFVSHSLIFCWCFRVLCQSRLLLLNW